ncbi:MAG: Clp protease ClpP [Oscillospiraceae bacterium]|nr:Clp protease ClpP [Oscillospiraceae bacterium]
MKTINITRGAYTLASRDGKTAELTLYGDIYEQWPTDWDGRRIEGQFVTLDAFLEDLKQVSECSEITVRMNSYGGDAGVANTIHNRLRELARGGAALTCIVDGVAMSGGSLIMCACDKILVNPSSLIMIHKGWTFLWGGYNADELRAQADTMDAWDKMQVEIYKRKTGLDETELLGMMRETTYMTGREAVEKGFADELVENAEPLGIAASADGRSIFVRGREMHLAPGMFAPDTIPTVEAAKADLTYTKTPEQTGSEKGGQNPMASTIEELREEYPELTAQLEAQAADAAPDAVQAERERIQGIDALAALFDAETIAEAKYGENACTAEEMTYRAAQKAAAQGRKFLNDLEDDAQAAQTAKIGAAFSDGDPTVGDDAAMLAKAKAAAQAFNETVKGVK